MPQNAASDLGLHCLPMSHKKDARLIWVNLCILETHTQVHLQNVAFHQGMHCLL